MTKLELEVLKDLFNIVADIAITSGIYSASLAVKMNELGGKISGMVPTDGKISLIPRDSEED